jgi:nitrate reductase gamma subunit
LSVLIFAVLIIIRIIRYSRLPVHLRWELYPVAHETGRPSGGSYLEELDWPQKARRKSLFGELKFIGVELFFFRLYYRLNRPYWYLVYPFHIGVFLLVGWLALILIGAVTTLAGISVTAESNFWGSLVYYFTLAAGASGFIITAFGTTGLLVRRLIDRDLKTYTVPLDYFNLSFILAVMVSGIISWLAFDPGFTSFRGFLQGLITFTPFSGLNPASFICILLICVFLIYSPFTRMTHYVAKFFTYHKVLWDDDPYLEGSKICNQVSQLLAQNQGWSGSHIQSGRNWAQIARGMPEDTKK